MISRSQSVKYLSLESIHFLVVYIEIRAWIPVPTLPGIIVQHRARGVVERSLQALTRTVSGVPLEYCIGHAQELQKVSLRGEA